MNPYWSDDLVSLYCGDFRDILPTLNITPDLVVTDAPYGETSLTWDHWPTGWPALIPGRSMWCFGSMRMFLDHRHEFDTWKLSQDVVWEKHNGSSFATDRFRRVHEHALHWYRGQWGDIHHDTPRHDTGGKRTAVRRALGPKGVHGATGPSFDDRDGSTLARSVIYARSMHHQAINDTEKPIGVLEPLIRYGSRPGDLILDVFAGSCSTLIAARNAGRRAIGIELREDQCAKAVEWRLSQAVLPFGEAG